MNQPLQLIPEYHDYVWGGSRLRPGLRTAEAWVVHEQNRISNGPYSGHTLLDVSEQLGVLLLGRRVVAHTGLRFPLLIKLLDCADWLSLQVHPNDEQALKLEGPDHFGKTEAWHILQAKPDAELLFGLKPGISHEKLETAVRSGAVLDIVQRHTVVKGDSIFIRPGMLHAIGPGLLLYEVQQTSNITYRIWDWNRPAAAGRKLHIDQSLEVLDPDAAAHIIHRPELEAGQSSRLINCPYFTLDLLQEGFRPLAQKTDGETFHILSVVEGKANISGDGWGFSLGLYDSLVIPADCGAYQIEASAPGAVLKASVEA